MNVHPKVAATTVAGALTIIGVYVFSLFGVQVPDAVAQAATVVIGAVIGYLTPSPPAGEGK